MAQPTHRLPTTRRRTARLAAPATTLAALLALSACDKNRESSFFSGSTDEPSIELLLESGEFGLARDKVRRTQATNPRDRGFMLDQAKLAALTLADGATPAASATVDALYDLLRQQGVNRDKTVATFLFGEGNTRVWRGEPFEQALAYYTVGLYDAMTGDWGNVRATSENALFAVRDFSQTLNRGRRESTDVGRQTGVDSAATWDAQSRALADRQVLIVESKQDKRRPSRESGADFEPPYQVVRSDFELGYALKAIAAQQMGEIQQAEEALANLRAVAPRLDGLAGTIAAGRYNTVLIVEYGVGPEKYGAGPDNAIAMFRPRTPSTDAALLVSIAGAPSARFPIVTDVNRLALDVRWNNLEDMRLAKSRIGDLLFYGGLVTVGVAGGKNKDDQQLAGLGVSLAGLLLKGTAQVDTRHNEALPQRVYIAPVWIDPDQKGTITLEIEGLPQTRLRVPIVRDGDAREAVAYYTRLVERPGQWNDSGAVIYANDATGPLRDAQGRISPTLPYLLGGRCVRTPSPELIFEYRQAGLPVDVSIDDLRNIYREEGIVIGDWDVSTALGKHVLEGGNALFTPSAGSTGFARLLGATHKPYVPRSRALRDLVARLPAPTTPTQSSGGSR